MSHELSTNWMEKLHNLIDGFDFETSNRSRVAVSLLHLSIEHQKGICVLVGCGNVNGSAFALLRPQFESYIRGLWYNRCATDVQIDKFISGKQPPRITELIEGVEKTKGFRHGALMRQKEAIWNDINDYTHGGVLQVKSRNRCHEIIGNYQSEHIEWLLEKTSRLATLAGIEIAGVGQNHELANNIISAYKDFYPAAP